MKPVKNFVFGLLLVLTISCHALAGETPIPPGPQQQEPPRAMAIDPAEAIPCTNDDPYCEQSGETSETSDYLLFEALLALLSLY